MKSLFTFTRKQGTIAVLLGALIFPTALGLTQAAHAAPPRYAPAYGYRNRRVVTTRRVTRRIPPRVTTRRVYRRAPVRVYRRSGGTTRIYGRTTPRTRGYR